jgi:hypothetical protein
MKNIGYLMLVGGFLGGAYATALDVESTLWVLFVPAAIVAFAGVMVQKKEARGEAKSEAVLSANKAELTGSLGNIVMNLDAIIGAGSDIPVGELRHQIDDRVRDDLRRFAEARESLVHLFNLQTYADIMSEFAAGERYVNRVWSASTDGYDGEARAYLQKAVAQFREAARQLETAAS